MSKRELSIPYCFYGEQAQKLPLAVLEQIVRASRAIAEAWSINFDRESWTELGTGCELSYEQYDEMRYRKMVEMLAPTVTEEQIATWDLENDPKRIMVKHLHLYNLLVRREVVARRAQENKPATLWEVQA